MGGAPPLSLPRSPPSFSPMCRPFCVVFPASKEGGTGGEERDRARTLLRVPPPSVARKTEKGLFPLSPSPSPQSAGRGKDGRKCHALSSLHRSDSREEEGGIGAAAVSPPSPLFCFQLPMAYGQKWRGLGWSYEARREERREGLGCLLLPGAWREGGRRRGDITEKERRPSSSSYFSVVVFPPLALLLETVSSLPSNAERNLRSLES